MLASSKCYNYSKLGFYGGHLKYKGKLTNWNDKKGFGFVSPNNGGSSSFVHISEFVDKRTRPKNESMIVYEEIKDSTGKYKAVNISYSKTTKVINRKRNSISTVGNIISVSFGALLVGLVFRKVLPIEIAIFYVIASLVSFALYWVDKAAAKNNDWRTPEKYLHLSSVIGGWPGAFYAQVLLRHKSSKKPFKIVFWFSVVINIGLFFWSLNTGLFQKLPKLIYF